MEVDAISNSHENAIANDQNSKSKRVITEGLNIKLVLYKQLIKRKQTDIQDVREHQYESTTYHFAESARFICKKF